MTEQWDQIYGKGSYVASVLGQGQDVRGILSGSKGTNVTMELHFSPLVDNGARGTIEGVASDNKGNLYKVTF